MYKLSALGIMLAVALTAVVQASEDDAAAFAGRIINGDVKSATALRNELAIAFKGGRLTVAEVADLVAIAQAYGPLTALAATATATSASAAPAATVPVQQTAAVATATPDPVDAQTQDRAGSPTGYFGRRGRRSAGHDDHGAESAKRHYMAIVNAGTNRGLQKGVAVRIERDGMALVSGVVVKAVEANAGILLTGDPAKLAVVAKGDQVVVTAGATP